MTLSRRKDRSTRAEIFCSSSSIPPWKEKLNPRLNALLHWPKTLLSLLCLVTWASPSKRLTSMLAASGAFDTYRGDGLSHFKVADFLSGSHGGNRCMPCDLLTGEEGGTPNCAHTHWGGRIKRRGLWGRGLQNQPCFSLLLFPPPFFFL